MAFLAYESTAEFFRIDYAMITDCEIIPYSETTLFPLTDAKFFIIEPPTLTFWE